MASAWRGGELGEEFVAGDLFLVLEHLFGAVGEDHVVEALVGGAGDFGVLAHDVEVLLEAAFPVRLAIVVQVELLAERREDGLADRHRCHLHEAARAAPGVLLWIVKFGPEDRRVTGPGRRRWSAFAPPASGEPGGRRGCEYRPIGKSVVGRARAVGPLWRSIRWGPPGPRPACGHSLSLLYAGRRSLVKPRGRVGGEGRLSLSSRRPACLLCLPDAGVRFHPISPSYRPTQHTLLSRGIVKPGLPTATASGRREPVGAEYCRR